MSKTFTAKPSQVEKKWYILDASGVPLGRLASSAAYILRGKNKPEFSPNEDCGDHVIILNSDKVILTGDKLRQKFYYRHSGYPGGLKKVSYKKLLQEKSDFAVYKAVKGMLPKNTLGRKMLGKLRVYRGENHKHAAQKPIAISIDEVK